MGLYVCGPLGVKLGVLVWGSYVCGRHSAGGGLWDEAADYVGGGSSVCDKVEDDVQQ